VVGQFDSHAFQHYAVEFAYRDDLEPFHEDKYKCSVDVLDCLTSKRRSS
jgi:hypothetical protein